MQHGRVILALALAGTCSCGPQKVVGEAKLSITGGVTREFTGPIVDCGARSPDGTLHSGAYSIKSDDMMLALIDAGELQLVSLDIFEPTRAHYQIQAQTGVQFSADNSVATLDVELEGLLGVPTVRVKGTMTCPPLPSRAR
ncbi:MAG: hypothetical protein H0T76_20320 [Nannocystis sp.]|nr:hypothetical protein [Nannocystis sp.]MBA3548835.1 hypothetical protein [Nannocystis sp.]